MMTDLTGAPDVRAEPTIKVFGGMGVVDSHDEPVSIGGPRQRTLLALLALRAGSVCDIDWLAEHLWDDDGRPAAAAPALRTYMSRLRTALPAAAQGWIETVPAGYRLAGPDEAVEHLRFRKLRAAAVDARERDDPLAALELLDEALGLWRGAPFRELEDGDAARATVERLELDRLEMQEERWEAALALGRHTQITGELATFTAEHALRDRSARQYALALHRSGRTPEAVRVLDDHRRRVVDETGLDPSPAVGELERALLDGDPSLDVEANGRPLRGYRLIEEAGVGAFAIVWRAVQPSVDRQVAIKQIRPELASRPEFIRRFEAEAHLVARLEHPHIVPLVDYWRDPDSAYLVMRWLPGGTLERRLDDGPLTVAETLTVAHQIGGALSAAHARGVIHRDVKAGNILFDDVGHAFLGDFGIALAVAESAGPEAALSPGSPAYSAPEQIRREPLDARADVFSLGVVVYECLTGALPFAALSAAELVDRQLTEPFPVLAELRADVPASVSDAVAIATTKRPDDRFDSVQAFLAALDPGTVAVAGSAPGGPVPEAVDGRNPYIGLHAFDDGDEQRFFGRERLVDELLDRLGGDSVRSRCVVVVGPSGSGKSSVVRAGLVPAVRAGRVAGSDEWFGTTMVPGSDPFESLEAALLRIAVNPPTTLVDQLRDGSRGVLRAVRRCLGSDADRVLLVIDQFEEVFTGPDADVASRFLDALAVCVSDPASPLRLVLTIRADYYDRPLTHPTFAPIVKQAAVEVTPLAPDELERAIVDPARHHGVSFEAGLVARIAAEATGQPSPLPLLQYALRELFDRREGDRLTTASYDEIGGLSGALAARAEAIHDVATNEQRAALRRIFGRLTDPLAATADVRRRVSLADLGADDATAWAVDQLGRARLITFDRDVGSREPTVEVAHEALLREWPRLAGWLRDDADLLRTVNEIALAATAWDDGGRRPSDLYRGGRLESAVGVAAAAPERLRPVDLEFVTAAQEAARAEHEVEVGRVRRLRRLVGVVAAALVIALAAGAIALWQRGRANDEAATARAAAEDAETQAAIAEAAAADAELATLISRSASVAIEDPRLGLLLALEAAGRAPGPETEQAVLNALASSSLPNVIARHGPAWGDDPTCGADFTIGDEDGLRYTAMRDGRLVSQDALTGTVTELDPPTTEACVEWLGSSELDRKFAHSPELGLVWAGTYEGPWSIGQPQEGAFIAGRSLQPAGLVLMAAGGDGGTVELRLVDDLTGETVTVIEETEIDPIIGGLNRFGDLVVLSFAVPEPTDGAGRVRLYDARTGEMLHEWTTLLPVTRFAFDDDDELVLADDSGALTTVDVVTGEVVARLDGVLATSPEAMRVRADGLVVVVLPGEVGVFDRRTGRVGAPVQLPGVSGARIRPDGRVVLQSVDGIEVVDVEGNALIERSWALPTAAYVGQGHGLVAAVAAPAGAPQLIDLDTGERTTLSLTRPDGTPFVGPVAIPEPDGVWAIGPGNEIVRFEDGELVERLGPESEVDNGRIELEHVALFDSLPDGAEQIRVVALDRGDLRVTFTVDAPASGFVAEPTRDGGLYVLGADGTLRAYDGVGGLVHEVDTGLTDALSVNPDPGSTVVAVPSGDGTVALIDAATGDQEVLPIRGVFANATFVPGGRLLALIDESGTVRLWDRERGDSAGVVWQGSGAVGGQVSWVDADTGELWVQTSGRLIAVSLDPDRWIERACEVVGRAMTQDEWDRLVPGGGDVVDRCA